MKLKDLKIKHEKSKKFEGYNEELYSKLKKIDVPRVIGKVRGERK